jgi:hypothetical protein
LIVQTSNVARSNVERCSFIQTQPPIFFSPIQPPIQPSFFCPPERVRKREKERGRRKKEERKKKETKEEERNKRKKKETKGRRKKEEGRRKKEEGRRKKEEEHKKHEDSSSPFSSAALSSPFNLETMLFWGRKHNQVVLFFLFPFTLLCFPSSVFDLVYTPHPSNTTLPCSLSTCLF